jgi:hypothetical protein
MPAFIIRFIVLGKIPGTNLVLSFWVMMLVLTLTLALFLGLLKLRGAFRLAQFVNPFYNSSKVDFISA